MGRRTPTALELIAQELRNVREAIEQLQASYRGIHEALGQWAKEQTERDIDHGAKLDNVRERVRTLERKLEKIG